MREQVNADIATGRCVLPERDRCSPCIKGTETFRCAEGASQSDIIPEDPHLAPPSAGGTTTVNKVSVPVFESDSET